MKLRRVAVAVGLLLALTTVADRRGPSPLVALGYDLWVGALSFSS